MQKRFVITVTESKHTRYLDQSVLELILLWVKIVLSKTTLCRSDNGTNTKTNQHVINNTTTTCKMKK